ncbi:glycosyltransferase family protein [Entomomonas asaccharolytica]|uniref:Uncharacterized protein n=1 Tax=Entomomonas asaccharolytica TaxID=2785331 RepID=A0A974NEI4_9GAMM|nr:hypothetical protein [Entomomonas asaccharolytica]QQP85139.1 hypothetical protein JHT90_12220 [Entomomonas asaccharolytica]
MVLNNYSGVIPNKVANQLLYIVYGDNLNYQIETKLSILSILRHTKQANFSIRIITDRPTDYEGWPVEILPLNEQLLKDWLGPTNYHYRRKAVGILTALPYAERTVFLDTDTILTTDANQLFTLFTKGQVLVDCIEGNWNQCIHDDLMGKVNKYLIANYPQLDTSLKILNSGVLGVFAEDSSLIEKAIELIDELWLEDPQCRVLEQFCLAMSFDKQRTLVAHNIIYHYWSKKEFFHQMGKCFFEKYGYAYQIDYPEKSAEILTTIIRPSFFKRLMLRLKIRSFPKKQRSGLLKLLYALSLRSNGYEGCQKAAYWLQAMNKDFPRYNPKAYDQFKQGQWPTDYQHIATVKQQQDFLAFLTKQQLIN